MRIELNDINAALRTDAKGYVAQCDALYNNRVGKAADLVVSRLNKSRVILLAGPSSSGKTTTASRLKKALADRGVDTMRFGPLRPVGLPDPHSGAPDDPTTWREPWAVVQLRQDNAEGTLYNLVGFQTGLRWGEQKRVFSLIPGLENAEFVRFGVMHRNTSVNAPAVLDPWLRLTSIGRQDLFLAGQITGVEGYMESTAMGLVAGVNAACLLQGRPLPAWPEVSAIGSLLHYLQTADPAHFQPMNMNLGIFPPLEHRIKDKRQRAAAYRERAAAAMRESYQGLL